MAIVIHCVSCKSNYKVGSKKCPKCGTSNRNNRKYRIMLRNPDGKQISRVVDNLELARELESKWRTEIVRGEQAITRKKAVLTLSDFWDKYYLPWTKENKKSWQTDRSYYEHHIEPVLGKKKLDSITPFDIEKLLVSMKKKKSRLDRTYTPATIKHQIVLLNRMYVIASNRGIYTGNNPCRAVEKPSLDNEITEFLSDSEMVKLNKVLDEWPDKVIACLVKFAMLTGARRGEILKLQWKDINEERKTMLLRDPKGKKDMTLPLSKAACDVLDETPKDKESVFIFYGMNGKQHSDFREQWNGIKKAAELPKTFRFHGLRHNFASHLVSSGTDLYTVSKLLTHKSTAVTQRYAHLADEHLREAANKAGRLLTEKPKSEHEVINLQGRK